jgi:hypothetical protein
MLSPSEEISEPNKQESGISGWLIVFLSLVGVGLLGFAVFYFYKFKHTE